MVNILGYFALFLLVIAYILLHFDYLMFLIINIYATCCFIIYSYLIRSYPFLYANILILLILIIQLYKVSL